MSKQWKDASMAGSPWEQQTNGERWRHRPVISPEPTLGFHVNEEWREGPAPKIIEEDFI